MEYRASFNELVHHGMILVAGVALTNLASRGHGPPSLVVFVFDRDCYAFKRTSNAGMVSGLGEFRGCERLIKVTKGAGVDDRLIPFYPLDLRFEDLDRGQAFCFEKTKLLICRKQT